MRKQQYAVFGPGHGRQWLGAPGNRWGSGHLAYRGPSLRDAWRTLAEMRAMVRRLSTRPDLRHVADTYRLFRLRADGLWELADGPADAARHGGDV